MKSDKPKVTDQEQIDAFQLRLEALRFGAKYGKDGLLAFLYAMLLQETGLKLEELLPRKEGK